MIYQRFIIFPIYISNWIGVEIIFLIFYSSEIDQEALITFPHGV